jgi:hypothetical protein
MPLGLYAVDGNLLANRYSVLIVSLDHIPYGLIVTAQRLRNLIRCFASSAR